MEGLIERLTGAVRRATKTGGDIALPNKSGRVDPRLTRPDPSAGFKRAAEGLKIVQKIGKK